MKKIIYVLFAFAAILLFSEKVEAKTILGLGVCQYNLVDNSTLALSGIPDKKTTESEFKDHVDSDIRNADGYYLTFGFTEIKVPGWIDTTNLFVRTTFSSFGSKMTWYPAYINGNDILAEDNFSNDGTSLASSIHNIYNKTGKCPQYLIITETSGKDAIEFTDNSNPCEGKICVGVAKLANSNIKHISDEEEYKLTSSNDRFESLSYYIDGSGILKATYSYKDNGTVHGPLTATPKGQDELWGEVQRGNHKVGHAFAQIYSLFTSGKMDSHIEDTELYLTTKDSRSLCDESCYAPKYPYSFTVSYNCKPYKDIQNEFENYIKSNITPYVCNNFSCSWGGNLKKVFKTSNNGSVLEENEKFVVKDFESSSNITELQNYIKEIKTAYTYVEKFDENLAFLENNYLDSTNSKGLCETAITQITSTLNSYEDSKDFYSKLGPSLDNALTIIKSRLNELGDHSMDDEISELKTDINTTTSNIKTHFVKIKSKAKEAVGGAERRTASAVVGCNSITPLMDFLQTILDYIRIGGIALAVLTQLVEYIKVVYAAKAEDSMKKANSHLAIRMIAVALLFLLPAVITFVLALSGVDGAAEAGTCGLV